MTPARFVRPLTDAAREQREAGLRSANAVRLRRCQILRARARGERTTQIAPARSCTRQPVREALHACNERGLAALTPGAHGAHRARTIPRACEPAEAERLRALVPQSPRSFAKPPSLWTVERAAEGMKGSFAEGRSPTRGSGETIRAPRKRRGGRGKRAKPWIPSPDPE
jgi:hypothetical protein